MAQSATPNLGWQNKFSTTLSSSISATDTTISLASVPTPSEGFLVIEPDSSSAWEIIYYTSKTASAVICPSVAAGRGQDDSTAQSHSSGATVRMDTTAGMFEVLQNGTAMSAGALGSTPFATGWITAVLPAVSSVTANGNRSYNITFASTVASYISLGQRLRTTRTVAAPTQCTSLNGSTQYYSKTSPAGMTFTDDFTAGAWIKLSSYPSSDAGVVSRSDGTSGWSLFINTSGQVYLIGYNGGLGNNSKVTSYQSVPLNKWVHISANLDMSAFATNTDGGASGSCVTIDGVNVPSTVTRGGTNPTALVQAGNLNVGAFNAGNLFPGKIAQAFVFNSKITNATMLTYISQGLAGTETSLISAYSFNNSINDLNTTNANNLTANGSAVATNADSPFGGQAGGTIDANKDYAIVQSVSSAVAIVQVPEGCTIPTSGGVSSVDMSAWKAPYGCPVDVAKWELYAKYKVATNVNNTSTAQYAGRQIQGPIGSWELEYFNEATLVPGTAGQGGTFAVSTATGTSTEDDMLISVYGPVASQIVKNSATVRKPVVLSSATPYYVVNTVTNSAATLNSGSVPDILTLRNGLL